MSPGSLDLVLGVNYHFLAFKDLNVVIGSDSVLGVVLLPPVQNALSLLPSRRRRVVHFASFVSRCARSAL